MKNTLRTLLTLSAAFAVLLFTGCSSSDDDTTNPVTKPDIVFYGLTSSNGLVKYNANNSTTAISTTAITGLIVGESLVAIDFRPGTGQLYGLGNASHIYTINPNTGNAVPISLTPFTPALAGALTGFDFNPTVDRIRIVTSTGLNIRVNPETGVTTATDTNLNPGTPTVGSAAYTNSAAGASATELFVIDPILGKLYKQDPPNAGTLTAIGNLGVSAITGDGGFDISANGVALANFNSGGMNHLYQISLTTGAATDLGMLSTNIIGLAIPATPVGYAVDATNSLHIFNLTSVGTPIIKVMTGLQPGETLLGIDIRPATGGLYALGTTGRIYTINTTTGAATMVGAGPITLTGTDFGFDFNPVPDRIRIVSNTGMNIRVNPNDGTLVGTGDTALNPGTPSVTAVAYTNSYAGSTTTTLYDIDSSTDMLYMQNPPNNGTLVSVGPLGVDVTASNGFDIGGSSNTGYAIFTVGGTTGLYTINTTTGTATLVTNFPASTIKGLAVGLGF